MLGTMGMIESFCYFANVDPRYLICFHPRYLIGRFHNSRYVSEFSRVNGLTSLRISGHTNILDLRKPSNSSTSAGVTRKIRMLGFTPEGSLSFILRYHSFDIDLEYYLKFILPYIGSHADFEYLTQPPRRNLTTARPVRFRGRLVEPY